jgi:hypothetical protein
MFTSILFVGVVLSAPVPKVEAEPEWMKKFREVYELRGEEVVRRIPPPFIPERIDYELSQYPPTQDSEQQAKWRADLEKHADWMQHFIEQKGRTFKLRATISWAGLALQPKKQRGDKLEEPYRAVAQITGMSKPEFIIDPKNIDDPVFQEENRLVNGDFVILKNAPLDKLAVQLEAILRNDCSAPVRLRVDTVEQEVFVVTGKFELKPPEWRRNATNTRLQKLIDVYATEEGLNPNYDHFDLNSMRQYQGRAKSSQYSGFLNVYLRFLGQRTKYRMVWDTELPDVPKFSWCNHTLKDPSEAEKATDADPAKVLKMATEQTGLIFTKAKRKVPVLVISVDEKK